MMGKNLLKRYFKSIIEVSETTSCVHVFKWRDQDCLSATVFIAGFGSETADTQALSSTNTVVKSTAGNFAMWYPLLFTEAV